MAKPRTPTRPAAMILASRLGAALTGDPDFRPDDMPTETAGVAGPGAMFHVFDAVGCRIRIRVNRV